MNYSIYASQGKGKKKDKDIFTKCNLFEIKKVFKYFFVNLMSIWQLFDKITLNLHVKNVLEDSVQKCIISSSKRKKKKNHIFLCGK